MADLPSSPDDTGVGPNRPPAPNTPRWLKVFGIVTLVLVVLVIVLHLTGNSFGGHTPSMEYWLQQR